MNIQELATIARTSARIKILILNNHSYGITVAYQEANFNGRTEACTPKTGYLAPDFIDITKAYKIEAIRLTSFKDVSAILDYILDYDGPAVCDVDIGDYHSYLPKVSGWDQSIEDMEPYLSNEEFLSNMIIPISEYSRRQRGL